MTQTIARLTPLADVQAIIAAEVKPVVAGELDIAAAAGCTLAADVVAPVRPTAATAIADGWALRSDETLGAGGYAPAPLACTPLRIDAGQPMPPSYDCIAPLGAVRVSGPQAEALAEIAPGEGVLPPGGDHDGAAPLAHAGERLTDLQIAALVALGIAHVQVRRPCVVVANVRKDMILTACANLVATDAARRGAIINSITGRDAALRTKDADAVFIIGGTGIGRNDTSAETLARAGRLAVHGIALAAAEAAGFGFAAGPVLLLPGRLDAALSVWLMLGRLLLDRLSGAAASPEAPLTLTLARKVTSSVGLTEIVPVRCNGAQAEPLATRTWPLSAMARAHGYIVISPESEGASAGFPVQVWPWP